MSLQDVDRFLRGNFFSRFLSEMSYWTQKNTVYEAFSKSYCRLINRDSFCIQLFTYGLNPLLNRRETVMKEQERSTKL